MCVFQQDTEWIEAAMRKRKLILEVTPRELEELINCVDAAARYGLVYGPESLGTGGGTYQLSVNYRAALLRKLEGYAK